MICRSPRTALNVVSNALLLALVIFASTAPAALPSRAEDSAQGPPRVTVGVDNFFGVAEGYRAPGLAREAGVRWDRVLFFWNSIQPDHAGQWLPNSQISDEQIMVEWRHGISLVGVLGNPPGWATRNGSVPKNLEYPMDHPQNYWARFVAKMVGDYAGKIDYWIIWNEPDIDPGQPGSTWAGTEREYYLLLKNAYLAARSANPRARIVFAGTTFWADALQQRKLFFERVLEAGQADPTAKENGFYFDAVALHIYSTSSHVYTTPQHYRDVMQRFGLNKPLWLTETNVVPWNDPDADVPDGHYRVTLDEQASFVIQAMALARAAGLERVAIYKMVDGLVHMHDGEPFGLVRNDGTPRPAYQAYKTAATYLSVPGETTYKREGSIDSVTVDTDNRRTTVLWNNRGQPAVAHIWPAGTRAWLVSADGQSTPLSLPSEPDRPYYAIGLAGATAQSPDGRIDSYLVGGEPVLLVEDGVGEGLRTTSGDLYFPITGYSISGPFLDYFEHRGGIRTFGYPISRSFTLLGSPVQFFQRQAMTLRPDGTVGLLNILDPEIMPYSQINGATLPAFDSDFLQGSPQPGEPGYAQEALAFVRRWTPDVWEGLRVGFASTYWSTVRAEDAFPKGGVNRGMLEGFNMEIWGLPTSLPTRDPADHNAVYQRFQRGVMRYDAGRRVTEGVLLAQYLKGILTGRDLPADLEAAARDSRFYRQYDPAFPHWLSRPDELPDTDLTGAFERQPLPIN